MDKDESRNESNVILKTYINNADALEKLNKTNLNIENSIGIIYEETHNIYKSDLSSKKIIVDEIPTQNFNISNNNVETNKIPDTDINEKIMQGLMSFSDDDFQKKSLKDKISITILYCLGHNVYIYCMTLVTIYSLFTDDFRIIFLPISCDLAIDSLLILSYCLISIECLFSSIFKSEYFLSFNFYIDFFSSASLILDCNWIHSYTTVPFIELIETIL